MMVEYKKYIGLVMIISFSLFLLASCGTEEPGFIAGLFSENIDSGANLEEDNVEVDSELVEVVEEKEKITEVEAVSCEASSECEWNEYCIDGICGTINSIYDVDSDCEAKCNFNNVKILTSDDEEMTLSRGRGSYTAAGALEWKLLSSANYCKGNEATPVAIELIMKNYAKIVQKNVIVLEVGDVSKTLRHPEIEDIEFHLTIQGYEESCSVE